MNRLQAVLTASLAVLCFASCAGTKEIPDDLTASQLIQQGQDYADLGFWKSAERYYTCALERYGTDGKVYVETRYELGHLHIKTKKWQKAYVELREIVQMYEGSIIGQSPVTPTYYKLAKLALDKISEKQLPIIEAQLLKESAVAESKRKAEEEAAQAEEDTETEYDDSGEADGTYIEDTETPYIESDDTGSALEEDAPAEEYTETE